MGLLLAAETDAWLGQGGVVVAASDRAARALTAGFHRARQAEGLSAWPTPKIFAWKGFVRDAWLRRGADVRLLLNSTQEEALWEHVAGLDRSLATLLEGPRHRLAALAMEAHDRLCAYAPRYLESAARAQWTQDAAAFSRWLAALDELCREGNLLASSRLPLEVRPLLEAETAARPPLLLAGFDRILPAQRAFFDAWGAWREAAQPQPAAQLYYHEAADAPSELESCARWCRGQLDADPAAHLLVIAQDASAHRGAMERAFSRQVGGASRFEFSLGLPLSQIALAKAAHLVLRWLTGPLQEPEVDWLLSTGFAAAAQRETAALQAQMRAVRRRGLERTHWTLTAFVDQHSEAIPAAWAERMIGAQRRLAEHRRPQSPLDWAELTPRLLEQMKFAGARPQSSAEFQAACRWAQAVEACGSLGFDGRRIGWKEFLSQLARALEETLFAPESHDAPILIAGPAESAGLTADGVWFLGADEDSWPAGGAAHPLLPIEVQREAGMPHATAQLDGELAEIVTRRLLASGAQVNFSFAKQKETAEARPSRLIARLAGAPLRLEPVAAAAAEPLTLLFEDASRIAFAAGKASGGSSVLTAQSQCPFKAFATARLAAQGWQPAEAGLTPSQRGNLLHEVLRKVWAGPPEGIRTHTELLALVDRKTFVSNHVRGVLQAKLRFHVRDQMPRRYLELEELRLIRLVSEWLEYEAARLDFAVAETEVERTVSIAGLTLKLRLDRIDRLNDGSQLVIDYKSGSVSPRAWELPRPDDVQLPLYAGFALDEGEELGGLVFAQVRTGELAFAGRVGNAAGTLFAGLKGTNALMKNALTLDDLLGWRDCVEQLARDFIEGKAEVDPRDETTTCERCGLQTLCRIQEHRLDVDDENDSAEADDE
jgi:ATP-dependent helicase/nuclease subunit B